MPEPCLCLVAVAVSALPARCVPPQADGQLLPHQHREEGGVGCGGEGEGLLSWTGTPRLPVHQGISKGHSSSSVVFEDHQLELPKGGHLLPTVSVMEFPHGLLKVGVELSHAAREEGVYHALREVAAQVCLEEGDQIGFVGLPWQWFTEAPAWMVKSSHEAWLWGTRWVFHVGSIGTDGAILIFLH